MKKTIQFLLLSFCFMTAISFTSCQTSSETNHETVWSSDEKDSVINVQYVDNDGQSSSFFMNYLLFRSLYGSGGYTNVYNYYQSHPSEFNNTSTYTSYKPRTSTSDNSSYTSTSKSYTSPSYTPSKSYTSPNRSYTSPSYTPSRSYTSPSRH